MNNQKAKNNRKIFRKLHEEPLLLPNAHDVGSAKILEATGFKAIASTSAGLAASLGLEDFTVPFDRVIEYLEELVNETELPVNADLEAGFSTDAEEFTNNIRRAINTGISGFSIEDRWGDELLPCDKAVERIKIAKEIINEIDPNIILVGRTEGYLLGNSDVASTIERLSAYSDAGADVLYAPGAASESDVSKIVEAVAPKPVNVLLVGPEENAKQLFSLGVGRVSAGGFITQAAYASFKKASELFKSQGLLPEESF